MARAAARCVGCAGIAPSGASRTRNRLHSRWGNRRRRGRRIGAVTAIEWRGVRTPWSDEVPGEVTAGPAGAPARGSAQTPMALRRAVRDGRVSDGWLPHRPVTGAAVTGNDGTGGSHARRADGDAGRGVRQGVRRDDRDGGRRARSRARLTKFGSGPREGGMGPDAERLAHGADGVVRVPDLAGAELDALGRRAEEGGVLADHRGGGVRFGADVPDVVAMTRARAANAGAVSSNSPQRLGRGPGAAQLDPAAGFRLSDERTVHTGPSPRIVGRMLSCPSCREGYRRP